MPSARQAAALPPEDNDLLRVIEQSRELVLQVRIDSAALFALADTDSRRADLQDRINDAGATLQGRADASAISLDELFAFVNADLRRNPPQGGRDHRPHGAHERALIEEVDRAYATEARIHREIRRWQDHLPAAIASRIEADRACAGYVAGWPARGRG